MEETSKAGEYCVVLFDSSSHAMQAEKRCKKAGINVRLLPVPKSISSNCGVCLRFFTNDRERVEEELSVGKVPFAGIVPI